MNPGFPQPGYLAPVDFPPPHDSGANFLKNALLKPYIQFAAQVFKPVPFYGGK